MLEFIFTAVKFGATIFIAGLTVYLLSGLFILIAIELGNRFYK